MFKLNQNRVAQLAFCILFGLAASSAARGQSLAQGLTAGLALPMVIHPDAPVRGAGQGGSAFATRVASDGHFHFEAQLNGVPVRVLFDTGASAIALRAEDAARIGIDLSALNYSVNSSTANGRTQVAPVVLASVSIGPITRRNVRAVVARPGNQTETLLGQSFLAQLAGYRQTGDRLVLMGD